MTRTRFSAAFQPELSCHENLSRASPLLASGRRQHGPRVYVAALVAHFKVEVWAGGVAGAARQADQVALEHALAAVDIPLAQVAIDSLPAIAVVDHNQVAIAKAVRSGPHNYAAVGS